MVQDMFEKETNIPCCCITGKSGWLDVIIALAKAKVICLDQSNWYLTNIRIDKNATDVIQLWHAGGAYKCFGLDGIDYRRDVIKEKTRVSRIVRNFSYAITSSPKLNIIYARAFGLNVDNVFSFGLPRSDSYTECKKQNEKHKLTILYAPTFRTVIGRNRKMAMVLDLNKLSDCLPEYEIIYRIHPSLKKFINFNEKVVDCSEQSLQEVLSRVDILITDYSSIIFDYCCFRGKILFFVPDIVEYQHERRLYFNPLIKYKSHSSTKLEELILQIKFAENNTSELFEEYMSSCDGKVCDKIVKFIQILFWR